MSSVITRIQRHSHYDPKIMFNRGLTAQTGFLPEHTQLLQDSYPLRVKKTQLTESKGGRAVMRVTGIFQEAEKKNANGRIYPRSVMKEAIDAIQEDIAQGSVWGEFDHPSDAKIHLDRISHKLTRLWMEGNTVFGEADVIEEMPYGKQLATLLRYGTIGISSRGVGDIETREGRSGEEMVVCEGYRIVTFDSVAEPSVGGATLQICEGKLVPQMTAKPRKLATPKAANLLSQATYEKMLAEEISKMFKS